MRQRLILGTINYIEPEEGWRNVHADKSERMIWDPARGPVDVDLVTDAAEMFGVQSGIFDEVRMWHTLEHLTGKRGAMAVAEVFRVLKPGGVFDVEVPDMDRLCEAWSEAPLNHRILGVQDDLAEYRKGLLQWFFSEDVDEILDDPDLNAHRYGYNEDSLTELLAAAGFEPGIREETGLALRIRAAKPA